jgi:polar amino acid transport system substrate-binding protein
MTFRAIFFYVVLTTVAASVTGTETVTMAIGDWQPYTHSSNSKYQMLEKVVAEAYALEDIAVEYSYFPWQRSLLTVQSGVYDGTFPWLMSDQRKDNFITQTVPLMEDDMVFFHLKSISFEWEKWADLKNYQVGVTKGYRQEAVYKETGIPVQVVPEEYLNFVKMLAGRIDVYETSRTVGLSTIQDLFSPEDVAKFTYHSKAVQQAQYYILFSKKSENGERMSKAFTAGFEKLQASGRYMEILTEFIGPQER